MDRATAEHCAALLDASKNQLSIIARYVSRAVPTAEQRDIKIRIGTAMTELHEICLKIYEKWPELHPYPLERKMGEMWERRTQQSTTATVAPKKPRKRTSKRRKASAKPST